MRALMTGTFVLALTAILQPSSFAQSSVTSTNCTSSTGFNSCDLGYWALDRNANIVTLAAREQPTTYQVCRGVGAVSNGRIPVPAERRDFEILVDGRPVEESNARLVLSTNSCIVVTGRRIGLQSRTQTDLRGFDNGFYRVVSDNPDNTALSRSYAWQVDFPTEDNNAQSRRQLLFSTDGRRFSRICRGRITPIANAPLDQRPVTLTAFATTAGSDTDITQSMQLNTSSCVDVDAARAFVEVEFGSQTSNEAPLGGSFLQ